MARCKDVLEGIDAVIDGEVSRSARARFALHLAMCPGCERYYQQYLAVRRAVGRVDEAALPDDFAAVMGPVLAAIGHAPREDEAQP